MRRQFEASLVLRDKIKLNFGKNGSICITEKGNWRKLIGLLTRTRLSQFLAEVLLFVILKRNEVKPGCFCWTSFCGRCIARHTYFRKHEMAFCSMCYKKR
jgi:hypothetical protein